MYYPVTDYIALALIISFLFLTLFIGDAANLLI